MRLVVVEVGGMTHQVETDYRGLNHFDRWRLFVGGKYRLSRGRLSTCYGCHGTYNFRSRLEAATLGH